MWMVWNKLYAPVYAISSRHVLQTGLFHLYWQCKKHTLKFTMTILHASSDSNSPPCLDGNMTSHNWPHDIFIIIQFQIHLIFINTVPYIFIFKNFFSALILVNWKSILTLIFFYEKLVKTQYLYFEILNVCLLWKKSLMMASLTF